MYPNFFGAIRNKYVDLLATPYFGMVDLSNYRPEIVDPEYIDGYQVPYNTGNPTAEANNAYAVEDVSRFEYVLAPVCIADQTSSWNATGLNDTGLTAAFNNRCVNIHKGTNNEPTVAWGLFQVDTTSYYKLVINTIKSFKVPYIGFIKQ